MRVLIGIVIVVFSLACVGCDVKLQPSQQGEWSDIHNDKDKVTKDARPSDEKKPETK